MADYVQVYEKKFVFERIVSAVHDEGYDNFTSLDGLDYLELGNSKEFIPTYRYLVKIYEINDE